MTITEFYNDFMQEIIAEGETNQNFSEATFTEKMCGFLEDQAIISNSIYIGFKKSTRGMRVDAWDYNKDNEILYIFVSDFRFNSEIETLTQTEINKNFKRAEKFIKESLKKKFYIGLEESHPSFELSNFLYNQSANISKIHFILLSNAQISSRVDNIENSVLENIKSIYDIWDITRLFRIESSGKAIEDVTINFTEYDSDGLSCLPAFTGGNGFESYLLVMQGNILSDLYEKYGERLLEQNVRTFLQFRGKVNKGLRNTIQNEPEMFFAFNNGLCVTAEEVETNFDKTKIKSIKNFQIVNGGQTTASIFTSKKKNKLSLDDVYVQIKLTIVKSDFVELIVPRISEYSNTQNKVSAADFFSNHPFHLRLEEFSRRIWAPSSEGDIRETHWYYERARGQYANAQSNLTSSEKKKFLSLNPKNQKYTKTDLAKFIRSFEKFPHEVSLGAQKNFAKFASDIGKRWDSDEKKFNELFFKRTIAKAIIFKFLDKNIMKQGWYGGYKANIVTYTIAKFVELVQKKNKRIDFIKIWKKQNLSNDLKDELLRIAIIVNDEIQDTPENITNVTEWCKRFDCWNRIKNLEISFTNDLSSDLIYYEDNKYREKDAKKVQKIQNGIHVQSYVIKKGSDYWKKIAKFSLENKILTEKEMSILQVALSIPQKLPSEKQCEVLLKIEKHAIEEGFYI